MTEPDDDDEPTSEAGFTFTLWPPKASGWMRGKRSERMTITLLSAALICIGSLSFVSLVRSRTILAFGLLATLVSIALILILWIRPKV